MKGPIIDELFEAPTFVRTSLEEDFNDEVRC